MADETWFPIPSIPGFELSDRQRVRRWRTATGNPIAVPLPVRVHLRARGDYYVFEAYFRPRYFHRVVKEVALGRKLKTREMVLHKDDDRSNNRPDNLKIGNHRMNVVDAHRNGRYPKGSGNSQAVLDEAKVSEILRLRGEGWSYARIAREYGVCGATVGRIVTGKYWRHVERPISPCGR